MGDGHDRDPGPSSSTGATGFIGRRLSPPWSSSGHDVRAMTRHPDDYDGAGRAGRRRRVRPGQPRRARWRASTSAVYLVHSLDDADFERKDAEAARTFGAAAAEAGVEQIVYLGGLGARTTDALRRTCAPAARSSACSARPACR